MALPMTYADSSNAIIIGLPTPGLHYTGSILFTLLEAECHKLDMQITTIKSPQESGDLIVESLTLS